MAVAKLVVNMLATTYVAETGLTKPPRTHSFVIIIGLDIVDDVAKLGFTKWALGSNLGPLCNAWEAEGMCSLGQGKAVSRLWQPLA